MPKSRLPVLSSPPLRWTEAYAQTVLTALEASGLSVPEFAAREGLDAQRLYFWRRRLESAPAEKGPGPRIAPPMFIEVSRHAVAPPGRVEIALRSGRVVKVDESIDAAALRRLIDVLEQESPC